MAMNSNYRPAHALLDEATAHIARGDYLAAVNSVARSLALDDTRPESWNTLAQLQLHLGAVPDALAAAARAVGLAPGSAPCHYTLGRALKSSNELQRALEHYLSAVRLDPRNPGYFCSLGIAYRNLGLLQESIASHRAALALDPGHKEALFNLASALAQSGHDAEARKYAASVTPELRIQLDRLVGRATSASSQGDFRQAMVLFSDALRLAPNSAMLHFQLAYAQYSLDLHEDAIRNFERAVQLKPDFVEALEGARKVSGSAGIADKAVKYGTMLHELRPSDGILLHSLLSIPAIYPSTAAIADTRRGYETTLDHFLAAPRSIDRPNDTVGNVSFYLAYHGECNRRLQDKLGRVFVHACPSLQWQAPHCSAPARRSARIRIGFLSEVFRNHSVGKTSAGLIAELPRDRFEVFVLNAPGYARKEDQIARFIREHSDHWLTFSGQLEEVRTAIAQLELDVLFYQDIGMTPFSYYLAFARLAPVQCVSYGHPDTTGIPNLDYFISNDLYEPPEAAEHYTEQLFRLKDLPTLAYYYRPEFPVVGASKAEFGIAASDHVYLCAQTLFKLHPDFDRLLAGILERDPRARIVMIRGYYPGWVTQLQSRFRSTLGALAERISFVPRLEGAAFHRLLHVAEVALDTVHFNGMNTSLEAFAVGTPVVTLPTLLQRGRHTQAMYRKMELSGFVARDEQDFIDRAVSLATEPDARHALSGLIRERSHVLYEDRRVVAEFARCFEETLERRLSARLT